MQIVCGFWFYFITFSLEHSLSTFSGALQVLSHFLPHYRVFSKGRNAVGPSKSLIFGTFSDILDIFLPFNMGDFSFWYFWDI